MTELNHESVMLSEVIRDIVIKSDGRYLDCTGGMGGHSQAILDNLGLNGSLVVCDYHSPTVELLKKRFAHDKRVHVVMTRYSQIFEKVEGYFDGILADFGISSPQLADQELGIGFLLDDAPLDMRIDGSGMMASDWLKEVDEVEMARVFFEYGGERASRRIARAIVFDREQEKFYNTTRELRELCERVLGKFYRGKKIHPATKVFQALRIAINGELSEVEKLLQVAPHKLNLEGRLGLISFHEGEDRLVKNVFKGLHKNGFWMVHKKAQAPSDEEIKVNPRARSAKWRVLERQDSVTK